MAIYSFRGQYIGITHQNKSCVAAAAYRAGVQLQDPRTQEVHNYSGKHVAHAEIIAPVGSPSWAMDRQQLWANAELAKNRIAGVTAREIRIALPRELTREQHIQLVRSFLQEQFVERGIVVDWALHDEPDKQQPHVHVMLSTRELKPDGFGKKVRAWDQRALYSTWREEWAVQANRALELAGHEERIDHRSYKERGIHLEPQPKRHHGTNEVVVDEKFERWAREEGEHILQDPTIPLRALTHQRATFAREDLLKLLKTHTADTSQFMTCFDAVMGSEELVELPSGRYTSREMLAVESRLLDASDALAKVDAHRVHERLLEAAMARADAWLEREAKARGEVASRLSDEQRLALYHLTRSSGSLALLEGHAGTGKSFLLGAAREAWEAEGLAVVGGALAGKAAEGLQGSSGIPSRTLAAWERAWALDRDLLTSRSVLVVDEAGMLGTRQLGRVLDHARLVGAKVVLVGDSRQLQAIEAGSPFRALVERHGAETLSEIRRQRVDWQREASMSFAAGRAKEAVGAYERAGFVRAHLTSEEARAGVVQAWTKGLAEGSIERQLMFAYRRDDVRALNEAAREVRRAQQALGREVVVVTEYGERAFAKGDRLYFGKNDRGLGVKNGTLGTVEHAGPRRMVVRLDGEGIQRLVAVDLHAYRHVDHGYAVTVHKSQGATLDRSYVLASKLFDSAKAYVAMSRHRDHVEVHWARDELGRRQNFERVMSRVVQKELALEHAVAERSFTLDEVLRDDAKFDVLSPVEQRRMIEQAVQRTEHERARAWRGRMVSVSKDGLLEHVAEGTAELEKRTVRWSAERDGGQVLAVRGVLPQLVELEERACRVAMLESERGDLLLHPLGTHESTDLRHGMKVKLEATPRGLLERVDGGQGRPESLRAEERLPTLPYPRVSLDKR